MTTSLLIHYDIQFYSEDALHLYYNIQFKDCVTVWYYFLLKTASQFIKNVKDKTDPFK